MVKLRDFELAKIWFQALFQDVCMFYLFTPPCFHFKANQSGILFPFSLAASTYFSIPNHYSTGPRTIIKGGLLLVLSSRFTN
jgi:hypothetical protein